ncbi:hypothetical protein [Desulfitibacter alkalitolerans]|nr:hypothetical protein [Desulfitibacter alkalitolerans]
MAKRSARAKNTGSIIVHVTGSTPAPLLPGAGTAIMNDGITDTLYTA